MKTQTFSAFVFLTCGMFCYAAGAADTRSSQSSDTRNSGVETTRRIQSAIGEEVGLASRDGITVSGGEVSVTRNGVSNRLEKELQLPNGARISPDGTVVRSNGSRIILKSDQILTFSGEIETLRVPRSNAQPTSPQVFQPSGSSG